AHELIAIAKAKGVKFTIGYSQRFNPKYAYVRKCIRDGTIGRPVTALVSRHITRMLGTKISGRSKLSPAAMEATHDLDFVFWCLEPAKPVRVYSQQNYGAMKELSGGDVPDQQWLMVTMDNGMALVHEREVMVKPEHARMVMEVYMAADLSAERNEAIALPLKPSLRAVA